MKQKYLTYSFILVGLIFAAANFYIFSSLNNGGLQFNLSKLIKTGDKQAKAQAVLPDVAPGESYTKSKIRDAEITKIKNNLPVFTDRFDIVYNEKSKDLSVTIKANTIEQYRENKFLAEEKLYEVGAVEVCILHVLWAVPLNLRNAVDRQDLITRSCTI